HPAIGRDDLQERLAVALHERLPCGAFARRQDARGVVRPGRLGGGGVGGARGGRQRERQGENAKGPARLHEQDLRDTARKTTSWPGSGQAMRGAPQSAGTLPVYYEAVALGG